MLCIPKSGRSGIANKADLASFSRQRQQLAMNTSIQIVASGVAYLHEADERAFFEWLDRIPCVGGYRGIGHDLLIGLTRFPSDDDLRELIAFFMRYGIDASQLAKFETAENRPWFRQKRMYWYDAIFARKAGGSGG